MTTFLILFGADPYFWVSGCIANCLRKDWRTQWLNAKNPDFPCLKLYFLLLISFFFWVSEILLRRFEAPYGWVRVAAKKVPPLMARPLRPSPTPSSLMAIGFFFKLKKIYLMVRPHPPPLNGLAIRGGTFLRLP